MACVAAFVQQLLFCILIGGQIRNVKAGHNMSADVAWVEVETTSIASLQEH